MDLPHSNGFASYVDNVGEVKNNGWEASASVYVIRNAERDINWIIGGQLTYNKNYVSKLSEAIKAQNEAYLKEDVDVANLFYEGRPQNGIYVVRSLGIDPANGQGIKTVTGRISGRLPIRFMSVRQIPGTGVLPIRCLCGKD